MKVRIFIIMTIILKTGTNNLKTQVQNLKTQIPKLKTQFSGNSGCLGCRIIVEKKPGPGILLFRAQMSKYWKAKEDKRKSILVNPEELFHKALENARPLMGLEKVARGGVVYTVPVPITLKKSEFEGMR